MPWQPITVRYVHSSSPKLAGFYRRVPIFYISFARTTYFIISYLTSASYHPPLSPTPKQIMQTQLLCLAVLMFAMSANALLDVGGIGDLLGDATAAAEQAACILACETGRRARDAHEAATDCEADCAPEVPDASGAAQVYATMATFMCAVVALF